MGLQWSAIEARELHNTRREWFDKDGNFNAQVTLEVKSGNRFKLVQDLYTSCFGNSYDEPYAGYYPRAYPDESSPDTVPDVDFPAPHMNRIGVISASIMDTPTTYTTDDSEEVIVSDFTHQVQVQYGAFWDIQENIEFETEAVTQDHVDFRWKTPLNDKDQRVVKSLEVPLARFDSAIITRQFIGLSGCKGYDDPTHDGLGNVSYKPDIRTFMQGIIGKTNARPYESMQLGFTFPAGTLLMLKPIVRHGMDMQNIGVLPSGVGFNNFGGQGFSVQISFLYKPEGHNRFWRPRRPQPLSGQQQQPNYGFWDSLEVAWEVSGGSAKDFVPFPPDERIDDHWLIPARTPRIAPF